MVIILNPAEDISAKAQGRNITIERLMQVQGDDLTEITTSSIIPQAGSSHPLDVSFRLTDRDFSIVGNKNRKIQCAIQLTYTNEQGKWPSSSNKNEDEDEKAQEPWLLDAQNVQVSYSTEPLPLLNGYTGDGRNVPLLNSAGSRLQVETQTIIRQISFTYYVKQAGRISSAPVNDTPIINKDLTQAAGFRFAPFTAMLMPMNAQYIADVDDMGVVTRRYWQIDAQILENKRTWEREVLDVGTMIKDKKSGVLQPIYQYTPWVTDDPIENLKVFPEYGNIDAVIAAKNNYRDIKAKDDTKEKQQRRWDELPYSEITEPLPLNTDGSIYIEAMKDPHKNPYNTIKYFETMPASWSQWNLPKKRA